MTINLDLVGREWDGGVASWDSKDALIYALGVGAGQQDPAQELAYTTENSAGVAQVVLPTFLVTQSGKGGEEPSLGDFSMTQVLHGSQSIRLHRTIPVEGSASFRSRVDRVLDKGIHAVIETSSDLVDVASGELLATTSASIFVRDEGGFGGERGETTPIPIPERTADVTFTSVTRPDQALLYRLSGDRNPLHSDPDFAARAGMPQPILHGLCSFGITARLLVNGIFGGDVERFGSISARFVSPILPGETLDVSGWRSTTDSTLFVVRAGGRVVLDRGVFEERSHG